MAITPEICWPIERAGEALILIAEKTGLTSCSLPAHKAAEVARTPHNANLGLWLDQCGQSIGVELEQIESPYTDVSQTLRRGPPLLVPVDIAGGKYVLALIGASRYQLVAMTPQGDSHRVDSESVKSVLCESADSEMGPEANRLLDDIGIGQSRRESARALILGELLLERRITCGWVVRSSPGASLLVHARELRLGRTLLAMTAAHAIFFALWILSWFLLGSIALAGRLELGWMLAWALVLSTLIPLRLLVTWWGGRLAVGASVLIKKRLLHETLRLEVDTVRCEGAGSLLGRVLETEVLDTMALTGGFLSVTAVVELLLSTFVLFNGSAGLLHVTGLILILVVTLLVGIVQYRVRKQWTRNRIGMTDDLVERMVGHRTRLAQEAMGRWHDEEELLLESYLNQSQRLDRRSQQLKVLIPRGWLIVGLLALVPSFVYGQPTTVSIAIAVGGLVLAFGSLQHLVEGLEGLSSVAIACERIKSVFRVEDITSSKAPTALSISPRPNALHPLVDARNVTFRYPNRREAVLSRVDLKIEPGDKVIVQGAPGSGKSTLVAVLANLRTPESGMILLNGRDRHTLGDDWRRAVALVPEFRENHILMGSLAFNLLMGRQWPPTASDLEEADRICAALGLDQLLERMPGGIFQLVGETGWQLSQGEQSRICIARALLQRSTLVILDESLGSLDPVTVQKTVLALHKAAPSLVLVSDN